MSIKHFAVILAALMCALSMKAEFEYENAIYRIFDGQAFFYGFNDSVYDGQEFTIPEKVVAPSGEEYTVVGACSYVYSNGDYNRDHTPLKQFPAVLNLPPTFVHYCYESLNDAGMLPDYGYSLIPLEYYFFKYGRFNVEGLNTDNYPRINISNDQYKSIDGILYNASGTELLFVPSERTGDVLPVSDQCVSIGEKACQNTNFRRVVLPERVTVIGKSAFAGSPALTSVAFSDKAFNVEISDNAFSGCEHLESISLPLKLKSLGKEVFENCTALAEVLNFPPTLQENQFKWLKGLEKVVFANGGRTITTDVFANSQVQELVIPESYTTLEEGVFKGCPGLRDVSLSQNMETIKASAFEDCPALEKINWPSSLRTISYKAFSGCASLPDAILPEGMEKTGASAFANCTGLKTVRFPSTFTAVADSMFYNCSSIETINLPESVTSIGRQAFRKCTGVAAFNVAAGNPVYESFEGGLYSKNLETLIYAPYRTASFVTPPATRIIDSRAFQDNTYLRSVTFSEGLEVIEKYAFLNCPKIVDIQLPPTLRKLGEQAFAFDESNTSAIPLRNISISSPELHEIPYACFRNNNITSLSLECENLWTIGDFAFCDIQWMDIKNISIPPSVNTVGAYAFGYWASNKVNPIRGYVEIDTLTFGSVKKIGSSAFISFLPAEIKSIVKTPPVCGRDVFPLNAYARSYLIVPEGCLDVYYDTDPWSNFIYVLTNPFTGVSNVPNEADVKISCTGGVINVTAPEGTPVDVYSSDGHHVGSGTGECSFSPGTGIYIVRAGAASRKVIL